MMRTTRWLSSYCANVLPQRSFATIVPTRSFSISTNAMASSSTTDVSPEEHAPSSSSSSTRLEKRLRRARGGRVLLFDGGTGEELFRRGVPDDRELWSARAVVDPEHHDALRAVHASYLGAGAEAVTTNSYGLLPRLGLLNDPSHADVAGRIARGAADDADDGALVLGSMGPLVESYRPDLIEEHRVGARCYARAARGLAPHVDAFWAETMSSAEESFQVVDGLRELAVTTTTDSPPPPPLFVSYTLNDDGRLRSDEPVTRAIRRLLSYCEEGTVVNDDNDDSDDDYDGGSSQRVLPAVSLQGVLFNCSAPEAITKALELIRSDKELCKIFFRNDDDDDEGGGLLLGAYANRLTPIDPNWTMESSDGPQAFRTDLSPADYYEGFVEPWVRDFGVSMVGGCCGITPEHIQYIRDRLDESGR